MVEILDYAAQLLCQQNTLSQCQQFISSYAEPLQQVFFFLLLPIVFLLIFVYILSEAAVPRLGAKFRVLIGVVILVFIILQGFYPLFLNLSKLWIYVLVIIVGLWFVVKYLFLRRTGREGNGDGGGGGGGAHGGYSYRAEGSGGSLLGKHLSNKAKAVQSQFDPGVQQLIASIDAGLASMEGIVNAMRNAPREARGDYPKAFGEEQRSVSSQIAKLHESAGDRAKVYEKRLHAIVRDFSSVK